MKSTKKWFFRSAFLASLSLFGLVAHAQDATWLAAPSNSDWNTAANWLQANVPTGTATFGTSNITSLTFSQDASVGTLEVNAPSYTFEVFDHRLTIDGSGILSTPANAPTIDVRSLANPALIFTSGTAGSATINVTNTASMEFRGASMAGSAKITAGIATDMTGFQGGFIKFFNDSTAANATITNLFGSNTEFHDASTAGNATITADLVGFTFFNETSTAGNATLITNDGGQTVFGHNDGGEFLGGTPTAGNAMVITNSGGETLFEGGSTGGNARFITNAGGIVDISALTIGGMTAGSIEGAGAYKLGSKQLTVGSNDLNTEVSGLIEDGGQAGGTGGSLVKVGTGRLTLSGNNTYSGGTSFNGGIVAVKSDVNLGTGPLSFNGGTLEMLAAGGGITSNKPVTLNTGGGTFLTDANTTSTLSGIISGPGSLTKDGEGTLILTGENTYTGGTNFNGGILELGNGGTTGDIVGDVNNNGTLVFDHSNPETFRGVISGNGDLVKAGSGTLTLTADNTYSGGTTIQDGTLVVGVPNAAQEISNALGTGNVLVDPGTLRTSSLETGNPVTISIRGNYTQNAAGTLSLGIGGTQGEQYDHVQVGGNANLNGTLAVFSLNNFRPVDGNAFEVLHTGGSRVGRFSTVNDFLNNNPALQRIDVYAPNGVALVYVAAAPTPTPPVPTPSPTPNPRPPINVEDPKPLPPVNPEQPLQLPDVLAILDPTAEQLTALYEISFSGANTQRFKLDERFADIQRGSTGFTSNLPVPPPPSGGKETIGQGKAPPPMFQPSPQNRWGVWANGWGDWVSVDNDGATKGYNFTTGGFIIGVDYRIADYFAIGLMGSYAYTRTDLQPSGDIDVNTGRGGLYFTYFSHGFYINGAAYGGHNTYNTSRQGILGAANGSTSGGEFSTFGQTGYDFHFGNLSVGPLFALQYILAHVDGFNERGSLVPLNIHSDSETSFRTDLGVRASYTWHVGSILLIPSVTAAWEHEYSYSALPITVSSPLFPGQTNTLFGPSEGHDSAIVNPVLDVQWTPKFSTFVGYQGQLGRDRYNANAVTGGFRFSF